MAQMIGREEGVGVKKGMGRAFSVISSCPIADSTHRCHKVTKDFSFMSAMVKAWKGMEKRIG
jgi:hypothetical protein